MADTFSFFEEGIKSYIQQSISKYSKNPDTIIDKNFDNIFLNPIFINDIALFKNLIQKNKLKYSIWKSIGDLLFQKINEILKDFSENINAIETKILQYQERIKKNYKYIEELEKFKIKRANKIQKNIDKDIQNKSLEESKMLDLEEEKDDENKDEDNLEDVKLEENYSKNNSILIDKIMKYNNKIEDGKKSLERNEKKIKKCTKMVNLGQINLLKLKIVQLTINILINEINYKSLNNSDDNYNNEKDYQLLNEYTNELIEKCELIKEKRNIDYIIFMKSFIIESVLTINNQGYKDINKYFLNKLLNNLKENSKKYSSNDISSFIIYIDKLIKNPDSFLCPNAFSILKNASNKKIRPRSRNNSFDKNDLLINANNNETKNNKNEKNLKIDDFFKSKKSESEEDEEDQAKKFSNIISFKNNNLNNFPSKLSFGLKENNSKNKFNSMGSGLSNNSLLVLDLHNQSSNLLNSSRLSADDSMSMNSLYRSSSFSELFPHDSLLGGGQSGFNSRLASQLPFLRVSKKEKKKKIPAFDKLQKKLGKEIFQKKNNKESSELLLNRQISSIVNDKFYENENSTNNEKNKNTTATENKKNNKNEIVFDDNKLFNLKAKKKINEDEVLVSKTPIKLVCKSEDFKEENHNENLQVYGIRKNLGALFNQHAGI